jgi:hypothetical protein
MSPHLTSGRYILILSPIYIRFSQMVSFSHMSQPKPCSCPYMLHTPPVLFFSIDQPSNNGWGVQIFKLLILYFSPLACYLIPLRSKYSAQIPKIWVGVPFGKAVLQPMEPSERITLYYYDFNIFGPLARESPCIIMTLIFWGL